MCAFYEHPHNHGRVAVLGSAHMLADQYLDREENSKIKDVVFRFLTAKDFKLNQIDADDPEVILRILTTTTTTTTTTKRKYSAPFFSLILIYTLINKAK